MPPTPICHPPGGGIQILASEFDPDTLRATLLLFDRLDYPANTIVQVGPDEPPGLEDAPFVGRTRVIVDGEASVAMYSAMLESAFAELDRREPGLWMLARNEAGMSLPQGLLKQESGFMMRLYNALPVPDRSVSYEEVLNYKERRRSELVALRHHIEELAMEVARDGGRLSETVAFEKFEGALVDHAKACREANFLKRLTSVDVSFSWPAFGTALAGMALHNLTAVLSAAVAGAVSSIDVTSACGLRRSSKKPSPFEYVFRAGAEL